MMRRVAYQQEKLNTLFKKRQVSQKLGHVSHADAKVLMRNDIQKCFQKIVSKESVF
jgi:hypothetical protein